MAGESLKRSFIGRVVWRPFDIQHANLLSRLGQHSLLFYAIVEQASAAEIVRLHAKYDDSMRSVERIPRQDKQAASDELDYLGICASSHALYAVQANNSSFTN